MSLYRQHQNLARMVEWAETARMILPAIVVLDVAGVLDAGPGAGGHILVLAGAVVVCWIRWLASEVQGLETFRAEGKQESSVDRHIKG